MVRPLLSHPLNKIPGDTRRVLKEGRSDTSGQWWPPGSIYQPSCGGEDWDAGCRYVEVVMLVGGAPRVRFHVPEGK